MVVAFLLLVNNKHYIKHTTLAHFNFVVENLMCLFCYSGDNKLGQPTDFVLTKSLRGEPVTALDPTAAS